MIIVIIHNENYICAYAADLDELATTPSPMRVNILQELSRWVRAQRTDRQLGGVLAFTAGAINAGGFLAVQRYTSNMTGFVSALANDLISGHLAWALFGFALLASFVCGAATSGALVARARRLRIHAEFSHSLVLEAALLLVFGVPRRANGQRMPAAGSEKLALFVTILGLFVGGGAVGAIAFAVLGFAATVPLAAVLITLAARPMLQDLRSMGDESAGGNPVQLLDVEMLRTVVSLTLKHLVKEHAVLKGLPLELMSEGGASECARLLLPDNQIVHVYVDRDTRPSRVVPLLLAESDRLFRLRSDSEVSFFVFARLKSALPLRLTTRVLATGMRLPHIANGLVRLVWATPLSSRGCPPDSKDQLTQRVEHVSWPRMKH